VITGVLAEPSYQPGRKSIGSHTKLSMSPWGDAHHSNKYPDKGGGLQHNLERDRRDYPDARAIKALEKKKMRRRKKGGYLRNSQVQRRPFRAEISTMARLAWRRDNTGLDETNGKSALNYKDTVHDQGWLQPENARWDERGATREKVNVLLRLKASSRGGYATKAKFVEEDCATSVMITGRQPNNDLEQGQLGVDLRIKLDLTRHDGRREKDRTVRLEGAMAKGVEDRALERGGPVPTPFQLSQSATDHEESQTKPSLIESDNSPWANTTCQALAFRELGFVSLVSRGAGKPPRTTEGKSLCEKLGTGRRVKDYQHSSK